MVMLALSPTALEFTKFCPILQPKLNGQELTRLGDCTLWLNTYKAEIGPAMLQSHPLQLKFDHNMAARHQFLKFILVDHCFRLLHDNRGIVTRKGTL